MTFESKETWMGSHVRNSSPEMYVKLHDDVILSGSPYVNSGVMYMNLKKIRMDGMDKALLDYKMKNHTFFVDQDAINMTFRGKILRLPIFYNFFRKYKTSSRGIQ